MVKIKICGINAIDPALAAIQEGVDFLGFIFYPPSPRHVTPQTACNLLSQLPSSFSSVAVTVNATDETLSDIITIVRPHYLQLHGDESPERVRAIKSSFGLPVIKACKISSEKDIIYAQSFEDSVDILLFDAKPPSHCILPGGNGVRFDWKLLQNHSFSVPWLLSGGLSAENVLEALHMTQAPGVDVSSGLELSPGIKSPELVTTFIKAVKSYVPG